MKLKAMVRGDKLELEGLSWRENVVMGEYLGVLATGEQLLELLPAFQEEERWREVMLKLELRVCRENGPMRVSGRSRKVLAAEIICDCVCGNWDCDCIRKWQRFCAVPRQQGRTWLRLAGCSGIRCGVFL